MKSRRVLLGLLAATVLLCGGLLAGLWGALAPEGPSEAAVAARARPRPAPAARPFAERRPAAPLPDGDCAVVVEVRDTEGAPLAGVDVGVGLPTASDTGAPAGGEWVPEPAEARTDDRGRARLDGLPCEAVLVWAGWGEQTRNRAHQLAALPDQAEVALVLQPSALVRVRVEDLNGTPAAAASLVALGADGETPVTSVVLDDGPGTWLVGVPVGQPVRIEATLFQGGPMAHGWFEDGVGVSYTLDDLAAVADDGVVDEQILVLDVDRIVQVRCLGMPDDSCAGVEPIQCTEPLIPFGSACRGDGVASCVCPPGEAAVRGGGATVSVPPGATEVWLDLGFGGAIVGRAVEDGQATACTAMAIRLPEYLEDLPRGGLVGREHPCDAEGRFRLEGLVEGDWHVEVRHGGRTVRMPPVRVAGGEVDVGDVELWGGGAIEGVVIDGLTDDPVRYASVVALRSAEGDARSTPAFGDADADGVFAIEGLPPGEWEVFPIQSPLRRTRVVVEDGLVTDGVEVRTAEASVLDENGFSLDGAEGDGLVVSELDPDGPAAANGLRQGDLVVGVTVLGFDSTALPPEFSEKLAGGLLGHWGGPGVGLVIERDGVLMDVDLE